MSKTTKLRAAKSWIMLGFLILVSFAVILLGREQQDLFTGRVTIQSISYMKAGSQEFIEIKGIPCLAGVTAIFGTDTKNNQLRVEEKEQIRFEGNSCAKFTVSWKDTAAVERMEFQLKVLEEELYQKGINPADLRLYVNGLELPVTPTKRDERYLYYRAVSPVSPEAGEYVIGKVQGLAPAQPTTALPPPEREESPVTEGEEQPATIPTPSPPLEEKTVQQPQLSFWQRFGNWLKSLVEG